MRLRYGFLFILIASAPFCWASDQLWHELDNKGDREARIAQMKPIPSWAPLIKMVAPAVVNISGKIPKKEYKAGSIGSGFIINKRGYIITVNYFLEDDRDIQVTLIDNRCFDAKIIGRDSPANVAILKIDTADDLPIVFLGNSDNLNVGDYVINIGNPFGSWPTASAGIVGGLGGPRVLDGVLSNGFIQTDASINPGNAGGPMCNTLGEVVGINVALINKEPKTYFAYPINNIKDALKKLINE